MQTIEFKTLESAAYDVAASSYDAHERFVSPEDAYAFLIEALCDEDEWGDVPLYNGFEMPPEMPAEWPDIYHAGVMRFSADTQASIQQRIADLLDAVGI